MKVAVPTKEVPDLEAQVKVAAGVLSMALRVLLR